MKFGVKRFALTAMALILGTATATVGCSASKPSTTRPQAESPPAGQTGPAAGGQFVYTTIGDAAVLLPTLTTDGSSSFVTGFVYDSLLTRDDKLTYLPGAAESYQIDQGKIYTFKLRRDMKFHDGEPLTSADVLFTFLTIAHPRYQGVRFGDFSGIKGWTELGNAYAQADSDLKANRIDAAQADARKLAAYEQFVRDGGMSTPDESTFRVELAEPFAPFLNNISGYGIMPRHLLEPYMGDLKNSPYAKRPVGTGAYRLESWVKDDRLTLVRNPEWRYGVKQKATNIEKLIVKIIPDTQANMLALETAETDFATIQPDNFDHFAQNVPHVNVLEYMTFNYTYLGYNLKDPMFADRRVRQAITHAINRPEIVDRLLLGHGKIAHGHASPIRWDYNPNVPTYEYDLQKANQLLDAAGWQMGPDGVRTKNGQPFEFEIATNNGNKVREQAAVIIQQELKKVGIKVKVSLMEWNAFLNHVDGEKKQAYILGWSLGYDPDAHSIFHSQGGYNMMHGYSNTAVDALIEQGRKVTEQSQRARIYGEMQQILAEDQVYTWLFFSNSIAGVNKRIAGLPAAVGPAGPMWQFEEWYVTSARAAN